MSARAWALRLRNVAGGLAVVGTLALLSPGVSVTARADSGAERSDGPACQAGASAEEVTMELERWMDLLRERAAAQAPSGDDDTVVLNNRGYYYGPPSAPGPASVERKAPRP